MEIENSPKSPEIRISFEKIIRKIDRLGQIISRKLFNLNPKEVVSLVDDWDTKKFQVTIDRRKFIINSVLYISFIGVVSNYRSDIFNLITKPTESLRNIYLNSTVDAPTEKFYERYRFCDLRELSLKIFDKFYTKLIPNKDLGIETIVEPISKVIEVYYYLATNVDEAHKTPEKFMEYAVSFHERLDKFCNKYNLNKFTQLSLLDKAAGVSTSSSPDRRSTIGLYFQELQERFIQIKLRRLSIASPLVAAEVTSNMISRRLASNLRKFDAPRAIQSETTLGNDVENELYASAILELDETDQKIFPENFRINFNTLLKCRDDIESARTELKVISDALANSLQSVFDNPKNSKSVDYFLKELGISNAIDSSSAWQRTSYTRTYMNMDKFNENGNYFDKVFLTKEFFSDQINHPSFFMLLEKFLNDTKSNETDSFNILRKRFLKFDRAKLKYIEADEFIAYNVIPVIERNLKMSEALLLAYPLFLQRKAANFMEEVLYDKKISFESMLNPNNFLISTLTLFNREVAPVNVLLSGKYGMDSRVDLPYNFERMFELLRPIVREIYNGYEANRYSQIDILNLTGIELSKCFYQTNILGYSKQTQENIVYLKTTPSAALITALKFNQEQVLAMNAEY